MFWSKFRSIFPSSFTIFDGRLFLVIASSFIFVALIITQVVHIDPLTRLSSFYAGVPPFSEIGHDRKTVQDVLRYSNISQLNPLPWASKKKKSIFLHGLSKSDLEMVTAEMQLFHDIMVKGNLAYFLHEGSLLGSYRHHGMVPWDDDLDIFVSEKLKNNMTAVFKKESPPGYKLDTSSIRFKFFNASGHEIKFLSWKTPFVDIAFYKENATHLWDNYYDGAKLSKSYVFPLTKRPFLGSLYYSPRDPSKYLKALYDIDTCYTGSYNHTSESARPSSRIAEASCSALIDVVPFVQHVRGPGGAWCEEVLTFNGEVLSTFIRDSTNIPVC